ncbi:hypothetical protein C2G38_2231069 [Gigaspora rosea]|uniref:Uncharacterized protein n=1 Tax=Gigaspora rosea TaxID=44941 RepID=A0A397TX76_9GLOM|nr:hypothetical protein C2G38_2231069 [Gigaspora rosea]
MINRDDLNSTYAAIWLDGIRTISKHKNYKLYGMTQNTDTNEYMIAFDELHSKRSRLNGKCGIYNQYNISEAWRLTCDSQKKNNKIIIIIIITQERTSVNEEKLINGKFGSIFLAEWLDGRRIIRPFEVDSLVNITFPGLMGGGVLIGCSFFGEGETSAGGDVN